MLFLAQIFIFLILCFLQQCIYLLSVLLSTEYIKWCSTLKIINIQSPKIINAIFSKHWGYVITLTAFLVINLRNKLPALHYTYVVKRVTSTIVLSVFLNGFLLFSFLIIWYSTYIYLLTCSRLSKNIILSLPFKIRFQESPKQFIHFCCRRGRNAI